MRAPNVRRERAQGRPGSRRPGSRRLGSRRPGARRCIGVRAMLTAPPGLPGVALSGLLLAAGAVGCGSRGETETRPLAHRVTVIETSMSRIQPDIRSFGSVSFRKKIDVTSAAEGLLSRLHVEEGERIEKGRLLAVIENRQLDIHRRQAESAVAAAGAAVGLAEARLRDGRLQVEARLIAVAKTEAELEQKGIELEDIEARLRNKEKIYAAGGLSEEAMATLRMNHLAAQTAYLSLSKELEIQRIGLRDRDIRSAGLPLPRSEEERTAVLIDLNTRILAAEVLVAQAQLETALSELESATQLRRDLEIRAPEACIVGARYVSEGERISPGDLLFTLFDTSRVYAVFPVPEDEALLLAEGMPVEMTFDSLGNEVFTGSVRLISPTVDPQSGSVTVKALFENPEARFKPGMFVRVRVMSGAPRQAVLLPATAIMQKTGNRGRLFTVVNGRAFQKEVLVGGQVEGKVEIIQGLSAGEKVIDSPSPLLREGEEVDVRPAGEADREA